MTDRADQAAPRAGNVAGASRLALFLRGAIPDFLLVVVASVALAYTVSYAFESAPDLRSNVLAVTGLCAPMAAILFAGSWSKRAAAFAAAGACAYAAVVMGVFASMLPADVPMFVDAQIYDVAENPVIFGIVCLVVPAAVFLLSRRRAGVVVLVAAGVLALGVVQFLYRDWLTDQPGLAASMVAFVALGAQFVFQSYRSSVTSVRRLERTAFGTATAFSVGIVGLCALVGAGLYFGVVALFGLQTPEIKLFEDYYFRPVVEYSGVYDQQQVDDPELSTSALNDELDESNQDAEGGEQEQSPDENDAVGSNPVSVIVQQLSSFDIANWAQEFATTNYETIRLTALVALVAAVAAIVAAVLFQRSRRERRLRRIAGEPPSRRVWELCGFLEKRFGRLGIRRPDTLTPLEFALASRQQLAPFARGTGGVDCLALTLIYQRACYGTGASEEDYAAVERFYRAFFANARAYVGGVRWLYWFWRM